MENIHNDDDDNDICLNECNGSTVVTLDDDYEDVEEDFQFVHVDGEEKSSIASQNEYIQELLQHTKQEILQKDKVTIAHTSKKELGLLHLFLTKAFFESLRSWTNTRLEEKGKKTVSESKFWVFVRLELAMSIMQLNQISDYWSIKKTFGQHRHSQCHVSK